MKYLAFRVDDDVFAVEISKTRGVFRMGVITPLPLVDSSILGVIKQSDWIWCVIDLRGFLYSGVTERKDGLLAIAVEHENQHVCLIADEVIAPVIEIEGEDLNMIPSRDNQNRFAFISACAVVENTNIQILSMDHLLHTAKD